MVINVKILNIVKKEYVVFYAVQFDGTNGNEIINWIKLNLENNLSPVIIKAGNSLLIRAGDTLKKCNIGDYVVMDNYNDFHIINQPSFEQTYNVIKEEEKKY